MMSTRDVAAAALSDVVANQLSESHGSEVGESILPRTTNNVAAASIEAPFSMNAHSAPRDANASDATRPCSSNNSQDTATSPPTSDGLSSQSQESQTQLSQLTQYSSSAITKLPASQTTDTARLALSIATNAGQKRTYDGFTKPSNSSSSASPPIESFRGHSRNTSAVSTASSAVSSREVRSCYCLIGTDSNRLQLVSELRTRLSYAMTKVNKGWEGLPLDEVESLTSQTGSPASSTSTVHGRRNVYTSPRTTISNLQDPRDGSHYGIASVSSSQRDPILFTDGQPSRTYESFWREQSQRLSAVPSNLSSPASSQPALAPSADFTSAVRPGQNARRSETPKFSKPPTLAGQTASDLSQSSHFSAPSMPRTPNRASHVVDAILQTTPGQKSIQEREAIETLMFMGSPGNPSSLNHTFSPPTHASGQPSPLRAEFGTPLGTFQGRNSEFAGARSHGTPRGTLGARFSSHPLSGDDLDRMLDMPDDSSDDEIEIPITPRRLAAGRV